MFNVKTPSINSSRVHVNIIPFSLFWIFIHVREAHLEVTFWAKKRDFDHFKRLFLDFKKKKRRIDSLEVKDSCKVQ